jgi:hypothetical protein
MLVKDLPVGEHLIFGRHIQNIYGCPSADIQWIKTSADCDFIAAHGVRGYAFDMPEPNAPSREHRSGGCNFYPCSHIDQWLNSGDKNWFKPASDTDTPHSPGDAPGFLSQFTEYELSCMLPRSFTVRTPPGSIRKYGPTHVMERKVALPSRSELGMASNPDEEIEGKPFELFKNPSLIAIQAIVTRTAVGPGTVICVNPKGNRSYTYSPSSLHVYYPIIRITPETEVYQCEAGLSSVSLYIPERPYPSYEPGDLWSVLGI